MGIFSKFKKGFHKGASIIQGAFDTLSGKSRLDESSLLDMKLFTPVILAWKQQRKF